MIPADAASLVDTRDYFGFAQDFYQRFGGSPMLVAQAQRYLRDQGYYDGEVDGLFGAGTNAAMIQFAADFSAPFPVSNPRRPQPTPYRDPIRSA